MVSLTPAAALKPHFGQAHPETSLADGLASCLPAPIPVGLIQAAGLAFGVGVYVAIVSHKTGHRVGAGRYPGRKLALKSIRLG